MSTRMRGTSAAPRARESRTQTRDHAAAVARRGVVEDAQHGCRRRPGCGALARRTKPGRADAAGSGSRASAAGTAVTESSVTQATPSTEKAPSSKTAGTSVTSRAPKPITVVSPEISTGVVTCSRQRSAAAGRIRDARRLLLVAGDHVHAVDAADRDQVGREDHGQDRERPPEQRDRAEGPERRDQRRSRAAAPRPATSRGRRSGPRRSRPPRAASAARDRASSGGRPATSRGGARPRGSAGRRGVSSSRMRWMRPSRSAAMNSRSVILRNETLSAAVRPSSETSVRRNRGSPSGARAQGRERLGIGGDLLDQGPDLDPVVGGHPAERRHARQALHLAHLRELRDPVAHVAQGGRGSRP